MCESGNVKWLRFLFLILVGVAIFALLYVPSVRSGGMVAAPYATFDYQGRHYFVSAAYKAGTWQESMAWCESIGPGYRLPTLGEAMAMRDSYEGNDPFDTEPACIESAGGELWTSTECSIGAYEIHRLSTPIFCDIGGYCDCKNGGNTNYCCLDKTAFRAVHFCPVARCVKVAGGQPTPTPFPSPVTPSPEPTVAPAPSVYGMNYVKPTYLNVTTSLYAGVYPGWVYMDYTWDFGDGVTETGTMTGGALTDRKHVYTETGTYEASLSVSTSGGSDSDSVAVVIDRCLMDFVEPWGERDIYDLLQFLKYFKQGDMRADLNGDGALTRADTRMALRLYMTEPICGGTR